MESADAELPRKRRRTEHGKRSKQGCQTCISKKVKCDEHHPVCRRCARLQLNCTWATEHCPSLSARRRGHGPIKERYNWTPQMISPASVVDVERKQQDVDIIASKPDIGVSDMLDVLDTDGSQANEHLDIQVLDPVPVLGQQHDTQDVDYSRVTTLLQADTTQEIDDMATSMLVRQPAHLSLVATEGLWGVDEQEEPETHLQTVFNDEQLSESPYVWPSDLCHPANYWATPCFPVVGVGSPAAIKSSDMNAVNFHRAVFAPLKSPGTSSISTHSIFLDRALTSNMAMHFLLAFSHSELAIYQGQCTQVPHRSWLHFHHGSKLLFWVVESDASGTDYVNMLISFLYMYMFWMRRDPFNHSMIRELSRAVLHYVRTHGLDDPDASRSSHNSDQILLCRILTYIYDRDGFCYFYGCGGAFASYVNENPEKRRRIWSLSRRSFQCTGYLGSFDNFSSFARSPESGDTRVKEIYFQLISIHHDVNCYSHSHSESQTTTSQRRIVGDLARVQKETELLNQVLNYKETSVSGPPSLMAFVAVTFYYALQIYFWRCRNDQFGALPVPPQVREALSTLIKTAYHTVHRGEVQFLERFQWALLIAGIESRDPVHQDWIENTLADPAMQCARRSIKDDMDLRGGTISMKRIRQLVSSISLFNHDHTSR